MIPMWVMLGYSGIFALFPIRVFINRCLEKKIENIGGVHTYEELIHKFNSDYMRENPITEKEGQLKFFDKMIENETDEKRKEELKKQKMQKATQKLTQAFSVYQNMQPNQSMVVNPMMKGMHGAVMRIGYAQGQVGMPQF